MPAAAAKAAVESAAAPAVEAGAGAAEATEAPVAAAEEPVKEVKKKKKKKKSTVELDLEDMDPELAAEYAELLALELAAASLNVEGEPAAEAAAEPAAEPAAAEVEAAAAVAEELPAEAEPVNAWDRSKPDVCQNKIQSRITNLTAEQRTPSSSSSLKPSILTNEPHPMHIGRHRERTNHQRHKIKPKCYPLFIKGRFLFLFSLIVVSSIVWPIILPLVSFPP